MLRPIGTQFWHEFPPSSNVNTGYQDRFLYEVTAHTKVSRFIGDTQETVAEEVKPIKHEVRPIIGMKRCTCPNCFGGVQYTFGDWEER